MITNLLALIPPTNTYVDVFGGSAPLLANKPRARIDVFNDINSEVVNFFRVLRDRDKMERLRTLAQLHGQGCQDTEEVMRAWRFLCALKMAFGGKHSNGGWHSGLRKKSLVHAYLGVIQQLPEIYDRLITVCFEHDTWQKIMERYDTPTTFFYVEPDYFLRERKAQCDLYADDMQADHYSQLVRRLLCINGMAIVACCYADVYMPLLEAGWVRRDFTVYCSYFCLGHEGAQGEKQQQHKATVLICPRTVHALGARLFS
jgi:DNA adenine methylase